MPSAAAKPDTKPQIEGESAIKQALSVIDKKVRNLEKRKTKLDSYRAKKNEDLNDDQREAIEHYGEVIMNLEFARELQKQFIQINTDSDKVLKKQAKRDKIEKLSAESRRIKEVLHLQNVLDNMGTDDVREDFKTGKKGALMLSEENLTQLDEWYQMISPTREGETSYSEQCTAASDHLVSFLEGKEKEVAGTTYAALRSLVQQITDCGYFDNLPNQSDEPAQEEETGNAESEQEFNTASSEEAQEPESEQVATSLPTESVPDTMTEQQTLPTTNQQTQEEFYSQSSGADTESRSRNVKDIVSSVQGGSFNFLQESQIDEVPHVDPAVVAAHPMAPGMVHSTDLQFTNAGLVTDQTQAQPAQTYVDAQSQQIVPPQAMADSYATYGQHVPQLSTEVPPPIPYPGDAQLSSQSYVSVVEGQLAAEQDQGDMEKPFHTLNPNAPTFYVDQTSPRESDAQNKTDTAEFGEQQTDFQGSSGYQGNNFQGRRGGQRGGRGSRGTSNGGGYRGNSRGGNFSNRGNGNFSGGASYQGYPPRSNYQPEGGYQGHRGGFKRGGGGARDGNTRGAGSRGGAPRGGGRGGNRGNFNNRNGGFNNQTIST